VGEEEDGRMIFVLCIYYRINDELAQKLKQEKLILVDKFK